MQRRTFGSCLVVLAVAAAIAPRARAEARGPAVTVYSSDLGLVREPRALELSGARDTVRLTDIPDRLDFSSVRLVPSGDARVTRLAYRFDVENGDRMIDASRGSRVRVQSRGDRVTEGTLLSADGSWLVVRGDDGGVSTLSRAAVEEVRLARLPAALSMKPTLEAVVEGGKRGRTDAELSYLTGGLTWTAEHVVVRRGETGATWSASVQVDNRSGRDYVNADLKLVAGEPRRQAMPGPMPRAAAMMEMKAAPQAADLEEQTFSEYHLYTLDRPATLRDRETQSLTLIEPRPIKVTPRYLYRNGDPRGVATQLELVNSAAAGPGVPLPAGRVRLYEPDRSGELQFIGETAIRHTAVAETLSLDVGAAFDLAAERRVTDERRLSDRERQYSVEVRLRDRKSSAVTIRVEDSVSGESEVLKSSHPYVKKDANTLRFEVPVGAGKQEILTYTVRVRY